MPIRDPENGLAARLLRMLGLGRKKIVSVAILPRPASVFEGAARFQMPADFRIAQYGANRAVFRGKTPGFSLTASVMPFSASLSGITAEDLMQSFAGVLHVGGLPVLRRMQHEGLAALRAEWDAEGCLLCLIRAQETALVLLWEGIPPARRSECDAMLRSVRVNAAKLRTMRTEI